MVRLQRKNISGKMKKKRKIIGYPKSLFIEQLDSGTIQSLPCVKGGGILPILGNMTEGLSSNCNVFYNPSVACGDSSLYTREPLGGVQTAR